MFASRSRTMMFWRPLRRLPLLLLLLALPVSGALSSSIPQTPYADIASAGPLTHVYLGDEQSAQVAHTGDVDLEFYPPAVIPGDAGTFLVVNDALYAPDFANHGGTATGGIGVYTPFTPVSQSAVLGSGTALDPYRVTTVVDAGTTGLRLAATDFYVVGQESYRTDVVITNTTGSAVNALLYRAADCYLAGSDYGYGGVDPVTGAVMCAANPNNTPPGRIEQWLPISAGANYYEASYSQVWSWIGSHQPFPDTCRCNDLIDNGAGLSWNLAIPAHGQVTRSHYTTFSPLGYVPLTTQKTADAAQSAPGAGNGYTISIHNTNSISVVVDSIIDTLPAGFTYTPGSTTGVTTADPTVAGQDLTWTGPFTVPNASSITLHFNVTVATTPGLYYNNVRASAGAFVVNPTGNTAPIMVGAPSDVWHFHGYTLQGSPSSACTVTPLPASCTPMPGVTVELYVRNEGQPWPTTPKRVTVSDASGFFYLVDVKFDYYRVVEVDPAGYVSTGAWAAAPGAVIDANTIEYNNPPAGVYQSRFWDDIPTPTPTDTPTPTPTFTPTPTPIPTDTPTPTPTPQPEFHVWLPLILK